MRVMTRLLCLGASVLLAAAGQAVPADARELPDVYVVSRDPDIRPEGIAVERDGTMYVTSKGTGRLFTGRIGDAELRPFAAEGIADRPSALGVHTDARHRVFSVGGSSLTVHDRAGRLVARRKAQDGPLGAANLNDLVITKDAVYVTDWANPVIHRAVLRAGHLGPLRPWVDIRRAAPGFPAQYWLLNGITADRAGRTLLVASNGTEAVWRVDADTKAVEEVQLGGASFGADGMLLHGRHLYAVLNYGAPAGVYIAQLSEDLRTGRVEYQVTGDRFDLPTTLARHGCRLYVVNSQLDQPLGHPPYTVSALSDPTCR
ncbi:hypothetical protein [Streptomyces sp. NPDC090057]|uniref:hypothetical protein n=1 Tax=Streptomyces sp. NPDC090057 TaxID=3365935 RepID=UPI00382B5E51